MNFFLLVKSGPRAMDDARQLLACGCWPLWEHTRCRHQIQAPEDLAAIYVAGQGVIARARVELVLPWNVRMRRSYPLVLEGTPSVVLKLTDLFHLASPIRVQDYLNNLSFIKRPSQKWGAYLMGGARSLSAADFATLTRGTHGAPRFSAGGAA